MSKLRFLLLNGPNLNLLGSREPELYGEQTLEELVLWLQDIFPAIYIQDHQTNLEGELVDLIQQADGAYQGVVLNAGGYAHTSVSIRDAIASVNTPVVEVHLTNVADREEFRQHSLVAAQCVGTIMGLGKDGYRLALDHLMQLAKDDQATD